MDTHRKIISEVEQIAVNAIVHQPDERKAAEKHFSEAAKKIVEKALQAVDIMDVGDVCRRAVTGAAIQDYDLLARLITDPDFDHDRLAKAIEALASEKPIDYPTFCTPGWLVDFAKAMEAGKPTDDELHEAATEEPSTHVSAAPRGVTTIPPGADGTPPSEEALRKSQSEQQREEARMKRKIVWKVYGTNVDLCVMGKTQQNGKVYEVRIYKRQVADTSDTYAQCRVSGKVVLTCSFIGGAWMLKRILTGGMQALVNYKANKRRDKRRNYAKRAAAKAVEAK